jgi:hypothetical protein
MFHTLLASALLFSLVADVVCYSSNWQDGPSRHQQQILEDCLRGKSVPSILNSSSDWGNITAPFNLRLQYTPLAVTLPTTPQHVSDSVTCAAVAGVKVQSRSGGHSYGSYSLGGRNGSLVVDLQQFNSISVDEGELHCPTIPSPWWQLNDPIIF